MFSRPHAIKPIHVSNIAIKADDVKNDSGCPFAPNPKRPLITFNAFGKESARKKAHPIMTKKFVKTI